MTITIDPSRFEGLPLLTKAIAANDYIVLADGLRAGRIMLTPKAFGVERWLWTITGPSLAQAGLASSGESETLETARLAFREQFDQWLSWALEAGRAVYWHQ